MNELADVGKDQDDIAAEANKIFEQYAEKADEVARGQPARGEQEDRHRSSTSCASGSKRSTTTA